MHKIMQFEEKKWTLIMTYVDFLNILFDMIHPCILTNLLISIATS